MPRLLPARILMLFLDGVGIGDADPLVNPFFAAKMPTLRGLIGGRLPSLTAPHCSGDLATLLPIDATLGVDGLPQSGTGQMALLTGINGARRIGRHFGPHPYSTLREAIDAHNVFRRVAEANGQPAFVNAYPQRFFDYMERRQSRLSVIARSALAAGLPLRRAEDLVRGDGLSADITGQAWHAMGHPDVTVLTPRQAGHRLAGLSRQATFTLFDYWKTDKAGHAQAHDAAVGVLEQLDGLLEGVMDRLDLDDTALIVTSDHGNLEDLSTKSHTRNPVPMLIVSRAHRHLATRVGEAGGGRPDLTHILPGIWECLSPAPFA